MNRARRYSLAAAIAGVVMLIGMTGQALALTKTISASAGPVPLPNVPVEVCVDDDCVTTPDLKAVSLELTVPLELNLGSLPLITSGTCPEGETGVVLKVTTGTTSVKASGLVTGTLPTGDSIMIPVGPISISPSGTVTVSVCAAVGTS